MKRTNIFELNKNFINFSDKTVKVCGWARTVRDSKSIGFIELNDGAFKSCQVVFEKEKIANFDEVAKQITGAAFEVWGKVILTPNSKQPYEISAGKIIVLGSCDSDYPLQKKGHSMEFLREQAYIRSRTNTFNAVFRIRSVASYAIHTFFQERNFILVHTPVITSSDCEGAGEMFQVTTLNLDKLPIKDGCVDYKQDFFGKKIGLTVSGQLNEECVTHAFSNTYTFGPTFRAEKSNTTRHAAEFWMMEPEMCFTDIDQLMQIEEEMLKFVIANVMDKCIEELNFLNSFIDKELINRLKNVIENDFVKLTYTEAVDILLKSNVKFEFPVKWGIDLQSEHEKYLTEKVYKKPVFLYNYPKDIKAFYMRINEDNKTVAAVDLLVPGIGELIGGSQREERLDYLLKRIEQMNLNKEDYKYYINLRRFGTNIHSGFGLGFERLVMYLTGMVNIRDVSFFPRTFGAIEF